jgi:hypothetical protein
MVKADIPEDLLSCILSLRRMQRPPRKQCAIKKLMVEEFAWTFLSQKGHTLPPLVSTWEDLLIKERAAVGAVEAEAVDVTVIVMTIEVQEVTAAVEDAVTTTEVTVEAAAVVAAEAVTDTAVVVAIAADPLLRTNVLNAVVHVPDLTHPAVIEMIEMGKNLPFLKKK